MPMCPKCRISFLESEHHVCQLAWWKRDVPSARLCAALIDGVLTLGLSWGAVVALEATANYSASEAQFSILQFLLGMPYFALMESSKWQATLGKRVAGLRVTDEAGGRISVNRAIGRNAAKLLSTLTLGIGFLMILFNAKRRGLHDLVAGTLVVQRAA